MYLRLTNTCVTPLTKEITAKITGIIGRNKNFKFPILTALAPIVYRDPGVKHLTKVVSVSGPVCILVEAAIQTMPHFLTLKQGVSVIIICCLQALGPISH